MWATHVQDDGAMAVVVGEEEGLGYSGRCLCGRGPLRADAVSGTSETELTKECEPITWDKTDIHVCIFDFLWCSPAEKSRQTRPYPPRIILFRFQLLSSASHTLCVLYKTTT